ncbi:MAG: D-alanine--D-alanine ligase [Candidatus Dormibacteraeota bacterium]|nr:D-alanine--D-alanine ligase [Candidatus Dormibacteraeota bacterium]
MNAGLFFGGRSVEHEVSVVTAMQVLAAMPAEHRGVPVYIAKSGAWYTGDALRDIDSYRDVDALLRDATRVTVRPEPEGGNQLVEVGGRRGLLGGAARPVAQLDVALPLIHGSHGEDGTLQGLFELCDLAYAGCGVAAAAVSMDKLLTKAVLRGAQLPVLDHVVIERERWAADEAAVCAEVEKAFAPPHFVKPVSLGSSIGVTRAATREELRAAVATALTFDSRCLVEAAQEDIVEINCAVLGHGADVQVSVCEQPVTEGVLTYSEKYLSKGGAKDAPAGMKSARRLIPAPLDESLTRRIQGAAVAAFQAIGAEGVARVDFLVRLGDGWFVVNELNTVPGSLSFYLWEPAGVSFSALIARLIDLAVRRHAEKQRTTYSIDSWLLRGRPS